MSIPLPASPDVAAPGLAVDAPDVGRHILLLAAAALSGCAACDPEVLVDFDGGAADGGIADDAGFDDAGVDSGFVDAGLADAGFADAGFADAGFADAGFADAGFVCVFDGNPDVPFTCEGDEDVCDPAGDASPPSKDLLAAWSHVEGDDLIVDVRFSSRPFITFRQAVSVLFENSPLPSAHPSLGRGPADGSAPTVEQIEGALRLDIGSGDVGSALPIVFPPFVDTRPDPDETSELFPQCGTLRLGVDQPVLELRVSGYASSVAPPFKYSVGSRNAFVPRTIDFFEVDGQIVFVESKGGQPNDGAQLIDICDLTCEAAGGTEQPRED
jgi:hypothetical protein